MSKNIKVGDIVRLMSKSKSIDGRVAKILELPDESSDIYKVSIPYIDRKDTRFVREKEIHIGNG